MDGNEVVFKVQALMVITARTAGLLAWMAVAVLHLMLLGALFAALWWFDVRPAQVADAAGSLVPTAWRATADGILAFWGLSGLAALIAYAKGWQLLLRKLVNRYVLDF